MIAQASSKVLTEGSPLPTFAKQKQIISPT